MNISLTGKNAVICGSTQGIGLAIAQELATNGATCYLIARDEKKLQEAVKALPVGSQIHHYEVANFANNDEVIEAINRITSKQTIHILINNTGGPAPGELVSADPSLLSSAFQQHVVNYQLLVQHVLPGMKEAGYGRIINVISTSVKIPIANLGVSNTIRAATAAWAKTLAGEIASFGITINNLLPGYTKTGRLDSLISTNAKRQQTSEDELSAKMQQQIPVGRFGEPEELAAVASFLASPAASYVNGTSIPVDGGSTGAF